MPQITIRLPENITLQKAKKLATKIESLVQKKSGSLNAEGIFIDRGFYRENEDGEIDEFGFNFRF